MNAGLAAETLLSLFLLECNWATLSWLYLPIIFEKYAIQNILKPHWDAGNGKEAQGCKARGKTRGINTDGKSTKWAPAFFAR